MLLQFFSLNEGAPSQDARLVLTGGLLIAGNAIALPAGVLVVFLWHRGTARSHRLDQCMALVALLVELLFDKMHSLTIVLLRSEPLLDVQRTPLEQLLLHSAAILPVLGASMDVRDVLDLQVALGAASVTRESPKRILWPPLSKISHWGRGAICTGTVSLVTGVIFGAYIVASYSNQMTKCVEMVGPIAMCARPRYYYANGMFGTTSCSFEHVQHFNCSGDLDANSDTVLPEAAEHYGAMKRLHTIDLSRNYRLVGIPQSWSHIPTLKLLNLSSTPKLRNLPYAVCAANMSSGEHVRSGSDQRDWSGISVDLRDSNVVFAVDWSTQVASAGHTALSLWPGFFGATAFKTGLKQLNLSHNNLTCGVPETSPVKCPSLAQIVGFEGLAVVDLTFNSFDAVNSPFQDALVGVVNQGEMGQILLMGNPMRRVRLSVGFDSSTWLSKYLVPVASSCTYLSLPPVEAPTIDTVVTGMRQYSALQVLNLSTAFFGAQSQHVPMVIERAFDSASSFSGLTFLNMDSNLIHRYDPPLLYRLSRLEHLDLSSNNASLIRNGTFKTLTACTYLTIHDNAVGKYPGPSIEPGAFDGLDSLLELDLRRNFIRTLNADMFRGLGRLTFIDFGSNDFSSIEGSPFVHLTSLAKLVLQTSTDQRHDFTRRLTRLSHDNFLGLEKLNVLELADHGLSTLLPGTFNVTTSLQHMIITDGALSVIANESFDGLLRLTRLQLERNAISVVPPGALHGLTALQSLDLSGNPLSSLDSDMLAGATGLTYLNLASTSLSALPAGLCRDTLGLRRLVVSSQAALNLGADVFGGSAGLGPSRDLPEICVEDACQQASIVGGELRIG